MSQTYAESEGIAERFGKMSFRQQYAKPLPTATIDKWHVLYGQVRAFAPEHDRVSFDVDYSWGSNSESVPSESLRDALRWAFANEAKAEKWDDLMVQLEEETEEEQNRIRSMLTFRFFLNGKMVWSSDGYGLYSLLPEMEWESSSGPDIVVVE